MVTLWEYVDHDAARPLDARRSRPRRCARCTTCWRDYDAEDLPAFARLDEVRAVLSRRSSRPAADARDLAEMVALAEQRLAARRRTASRPCTATPGSATCCAPRTGPLWSDFELACVGPRELDLACNETSARDRGRTPEDDAFLAGYGDHDAGLLEWVTPLELVPLTAWTYRLAATQPEFLETRAHASDLGTRGT